MQYIYCVILRTMYVHKEKTKQFNVYIKLGKKINNKKQSMDHTCKNIIHTFVSIVLCPVQLCIIA